MSFLDSVREYFLGRPVQLAASTSAADVEDDPGLTVTGDDLIDRIFQSIKLRRSVLVTGPRGCGKSYCSEQAIRRARDEGLIGGWRFLQGNREVPRDTLSEDMLIVGDGGKVELMTALALRPIEGSAPRRPEYPDWPGIASSAVTTNHDPRTLWTPRDWTVLYLDEINRFGDGFLDSLLSVIEEGKIVRRGEDYYVPLIVVATANPPGYDATAKKLSPPLQARITRSFRVSQPPVDTLVRVIIPEAIKRASRFLHSATPPDVPEDVRVKAAAVTTCLWGDPDSGAKGTFFMTAESRAQLRRAMREDPELARMMRELSELISFGPDSRAVADWIACAMARAADASDPAVHDRHLEATAVEVLGHKLRESFNEGTDPVRSIRKDRLVLGITTRVTGTPTLLACFTPRPVPTVPSALPEDRRANRVSSSSTGQETRAASTGEHAAAPPERTVVDARGLELEDKVAVLRRGQTTVSSALAPPVDLDSHFAEFETSAIFQRQLRIVFERGRGGLFDDARSTRAWLQMLDMCLQPWATPEDVAREVERGFWALYRCHRPAEGLLHPPTLDVVFEAYDDSFRLVAEHANPAGAERMNAARTALQELKNHVQAAANHPANAPGGSGTAWRTP